MKNHSTVLVGSASRCWDCCWPRRPWPPRLAPPEQRLRRATFTEPSGWALAAAFAVAVSILGAGYAVGKIGSAALGAAAEKPELLIRSLLFVALAEGLAVLGFAIAMMLIQKM